MIVFGRKRQLCRRAAVLGTLCLFPWTLAVSQTQAAGTAPLPRGSGLIGPAVTFGSFIAATLADGSIRGFSQHNRGSLGNGLASLGNVLGDPRYVLPAVGVAGATSALLGNGDAAGDLLQVGKTVVVAGAVSQLLKFGIGRLRPEPSEGNTGRFEPFAHGDGHTSFPSGHTTVAFALATALADRASSPVVAGLAYTGAALTGFGRINDDRHWLSDVMAGALIGHITARVLGPGSTNIGRSTGQFGVAVAGALVGQLAAKAFGGSRVQIGGLPGGVGLSLTF